MPGNWGTETEFELTTLERLRALGYTHAIGAEIAEKHREADSEVVFRRILREHLTKRYSHLPAESIDEAVRLFARPDGVDTLRRNMAFHAMLRTGVEVRVERTDGTHKVEHVYAVDWDRPEDNIFLAVNQLPISGGNNRRPDILIYVNGLPLVLFELKNPYSIAPSEEEALNQIQHYTVDIPQVFDFNALCIVSDGVSTRHGVWTATPEWYAPWKSINGEHIEPGTTGSMRALIEGLFPKERLLSYIRDFIAFEVANEKITKKGAKYHQFFAVRKAAAKAIETHRAGTDRRLGVIWHTTGSGKSLSMAFLVGLLRRRPELENPSFVIQVDRTDLDDQLFDQFVAVRSLVGEVKHAESVEQLRDLLATSGGEVIFTTIEKFRLRTDRGEIAHPILSERSNIIVIADEAHRSQYGFLKGFARYLADALPNARRLGFTGTPVSLGSADTVAVFGDLIHTYDIRQSQEDKATVPIFYEPRQVRLHLSADDIDASLKDITDGLEEAEESDLERRKSRWAALAAAAGAKHLDDCRQHADDIIFCQRVRNQLRKALPGRTKKGAIEQAVRDLVDDAVESEGVVDIFTAAGIPRADISVLDEQFLQTFKDKPQQNLRLMLLEQLLADDIRRRQPRNVAQAKSFRELLEKTLQRYHNRLIDAAAVVAEMLRMKQEMDASDARARQLGLAEEEVAFYDAIAENAARVYDEAFLRDLVHDVVQTIKRNLKVDWTEPHRDQVRAEIRAAVKRVLRKRGVREADFEPFIARFIQQAEAQYAEWPLVA